MVVTDLFRRILAANNVFYKHQQHDDADLTEDDRLQILSDLYDTNKTLFVERYGAHMIKEDCDNIDIGSNNDFLQFLIDRIKSSLAAKTNILNVRNRRFLAIHDLKLKGDFFSDQKMREREPYLYDVMVGRFLSDTDQAQLRPSVTRTDQDRDRPSGFGDLLSQFEDSKEIAQRRNVHREEWEPEVKSSNAADQRKGRLMAHVSNMMDTVEDQEEEDSEDCDNLNELREQLDMISQEEAESLENCMDGTEEQLRSEFDAFMVERFLAGKDSRFFDYSDVDSDQRLDDMDVIRERDAEEAWFDDDE